MPSTCNLYVLSFCARRSRISLYHFFIFAASESSLKNVELSEIENLGTKMTVRYGVQLKLLQSFSEGIEDLTYLLKYSKFFLRGQQRSTDVTLRILGDLTDTVLN